MTFLAEARKYVALIAGRIPLVKPHYCPRCDTWIESIGRRQFADWQKAQSLDPGNAPTLFHYCGSPLQCGGRKPITVKELTGEDR